MLGLVSWRAMPVAARVLLGILVAVTAVLTVQDGTPWVNLPATPFEMLYNAVLVGVRGALLHARGRTSQRAAWPGR